MALTPRLDLRQTQSLVMTPQLQQAIKLLQLSSLELSTYIDGQLEQNPLLERDENFGDGLEVNGTALEPERAAQPLSADPPAVDAAVRDEGQAFADADLDSDVYGNLFDGDSYADGGGDYGAGDGLSTIKSRSGSFEGNDAFAENLLCGRPTLQEHLSQQIMMEIGDPVERMIAALLIDMLDEAGYLTGDLASVAATLGCPLERVEWTLARVQQFDPPGVFARSLQECLSLQLREQGRLSPVMEILLRHLHLVGRRDWQALSRACGVGGEAVARLVAEIRGLNPKPALAFDHVVAQPVTPDVLMRPHPSGGFVVELNSETLPRVLVNNQYYTQISRVVRNRDEKQYINECLQSANWLVKSLHQRATTILKVATEIVRQQQAFFVSGVQALRPLVLRDIADAIGMHESTVSRVTSNKFIATPRGIFELKYFFTHAVGGGNGGDVHSAESVRHRIKALIDTEPPNAVLSDDALADVLQKEGIDIARRTVAKYREALHIPSSVQRRREKGEIP